MDVMAGIPWELKCPKVRSREGLFQGWLQRGGWWGDMGACETQKG